MKPQEPRNRAERKAAKANLRKAKLNQVDAINEKLAERVGNIESTHSISLHPTKGYKYNSLKRLSLPDSIIGRLQIIQNLLTRAEEHCRKTYGVV